MASRAQIIFKKALTPITIMVVPHENFRSLNLKIPTAVIFLIISLSAVGCFYLFTLAANGLEYPFLIKKVNFYKEQFSQWNSTVSSLKEAEEKFRTIFSLPSKEKVLENMDESNSGSIDLGSLINEIQNSLETVDEIKEYLRVQKNIYLATPLGYPVIGKVTSPFGKRENPFTQAPSFHSGVDISAKPWTGIQATAEGAVSYAGWTSGSGYVVVVEHGLGFSTVYAHNSKNEVKVGQRVKRGDVIARVGSTGKSTGPHVHYEIWDKRKSVNPKKFLQGGA